MVMAGVGKKKKTYKKFACKSENKLGPSMWMCVLGFVLSDNTLTGLRLLKDRIKAPKHPTP